jgi:hypothetical protein
MKREDFNHRLGEIVKRLTELSEQDKQIIQPNAAREQVVIDIKELFAYGHRFEEREKLHDELRSLASVNVEET